MGAGEQGLRCRDWHVIPESGCLGRRKLSPFEEKTVDYEEIVGEKHIDPSFQLDPTGI